MQSKRGELVPVAEVVSDLGGPVAAIRDASPQALHHFTRFDQVNQLVSASGDYPQAADVTFKKAQRVRSNPSEKQKILPMEGEPLNPRDR